MLFRTVNKHFLLVLDCGVLKTPVSCGFLLTPLSGFSEKFLFSLKRIWDQKLSSGLMFLTLMTTHFFQIRFEDTLQYWNQSWLQCVVSTLFYVYVVVATNS